MTMSPTVYRAILAMDAYNRGYGANLELIGDSIGLIQILSRESFAITEGQYALWQTAGFYASAYSWNGETIISYRGTNFNLNDGANIADSSAFRDIWNGWSLGTGFSSASQAGLALEFYQAVAGVTSRFSANLCYETRHLVRLQRIPAFQPDAWLWRQDISHSAECFV